MKKSLLIIFLGFVFLPVRMVAQVGNTFEKFRSEREKKFEEYREARRKEFEEFRRKRNEEFAKYLRNTWRPIDSAPIIPLPKENPVPPVVIPKGEVPPFEPPEPKPLPFEEVVHVPKPKPQPEPVEPIEEVPEPESVTPTPVKPEVLKVQFTFFGTTSEVRVDKKELFRLNAVNENAIADAWLKLSTERYTNLIYDCLQIRKERDLCDWAYLQMLHSMANAVCGRGTDESTLLMAYVYCQSGYKMRLSIGGDGKLYMMFASDHVIYNWNYYYIDGEKFYAFNNKNGQVNICVQEYPNEKAMSLNVTKEQKFDMSAAAPSSHQSKRDEDMRVTMTANRNMLDFYTSYPTSKIGDNDVSRWALYANTPMTESVKKQVYPSLKAAIADCDQWTAVNKILNFVQTGFVYEYDDKVWGCDRAFFPEESLHYPYCDCEDRSILFTRIVRDLLDLKCILIFYPGHLASAVEFTEGTPSGDYIALNGRRFFIADGTIVGYGAPVGTTMSGMDNKTAKVLLLE